MRAAEMRTRTGPEMRGRAHTHGARARASSGARGARDVVVQLRSAHSSGDARAHTHTWSSCSRELRSDVDPVIAWCSSGARTAAEMRARAHTHGTRARASSGARGARHLVVQLRSSWSPVQRELVSGPGRYTGRAARTHRGRCSWPTLAAASCLSCVCAWEDLLGFGQRPHVREERNEVS